MTRTLLWLMCVLLPGAAGAHGRTTGAPPLPLVPARTLHITTDSGSWMSLDLSPDGRTIVFDLLGDLYVLPSGGGRARQITRGLGFDTQPTFSPDGRRLAFVSDRSGAENLWIARPDGRGARQVTFGDDDTVLTSPAWSADGRALFVSRFRADYDQYELWRYDLAGHGELLVPIQPGADAPRATWRSSLGASPSGDGRYLYFARHVGDLNFDEVDRWTIVRRDLSSGAETVVIGTEAGQGVERGSAFRPAIAADGHRLFYVLRRGSRAELRMRDLATGDDRQVVAALDPDQLQSSAWQDLAARYAVTPAGDAVLLARANHLERIALADRRVTPVPFTAAMAVDVGPSTRQPLREETGPVRSRLAQAPVASPDGRTIAYAALGGIYLRPFDGSRPARRLAEGYQPSWSPDGRRLAFVTWSECDGGAIWSVDAGGDAAPRRLDEGSAFYTYPVFTPDGRSIVAERSATAARQRLNFEFAHLRDDQLVLLAAGGGAARVLAAGRFHGRPHFSAAAPGAVFVAGQDGLDRVDFAGGAVSLVAQVKGPGYYFAHGSAPVDDLRLSPDGRWLLAQVVEQLYLLPRPSAGATVEIEGNAAVRRISMTGADFFEWTRDGGIDWSVGATLSRLAFGVLPDVHAIPSTLDLAVELPRVRPAGTLLLRGARILTMAGDDRVIADGDILVRGDRIAAVGARGSFAVPPGVPIRDLAGTTVLPGFIDEHDHVAEIHRDVPSTEDWGLRARLAYGVTTSFDPSTLTIDMLAYQDLLDAGLMVGPRQRSTGPALFSMERIASLDDARRVLRRYRDSYRLGNVKEYRTGNRRVRQWMAIAARELALQPTTEGTLALKLDVSQILDGFAGNEHVLPAEPLGHDIVALMGAMRTSYAETLMTTNSGPPGADWFAAAEDAGADAKLRRFWTPAAIEQKLENRPWRPLRAYRFREATAGAAALAAAGGLVGIGSHGEAPGIGFHWEMEAHVLGGMTPQAVLHAATAGSAETIGRLADLGTIEAGKLADLVVLARDPREDIRNTRAIVAVMRGGSLYDGETLEQIWPDREAGDQPWFGTGDDQNWLPAPPGPQ